MKQYYTGEEVAAMMHVSERMVAKWRQKGILKSIRTGKGFIYREDWIETMTTAFEGEDISSDMGIDLAIQIKRAEKKSAPVREDNRRASDPLIKDTYVF